MFTSETRSGRMSKTERFSIYGTIYEANFEDKTFQLYYDDLGENDGKLTLTETRGPNAGNKQTLQVKILELRPKLFMVTWQEASKLSVTEIEDYEKGELYANITTPKNNFFTLKATLRTMSK